MSQPDDSPEFEILNDDELNANPANDAASHTEPNPHFRRYTQQELDAATDPSSAQPGRMANEFFAKAGGDSSAEYRPQDRHDGNNASAAAGCLVVCVCIAIAFFIMRSPSGIPASNNDSKRLNEPVKTTGVQQVSNDPFYDPARKHPYKANQISYFDTREEAIRALARQFGRSSAWVERNMGSSNDVAKIHVALVSAWTEEIGLKEEFERLEKKNE